MANNSTDMMTKKELNSIALHSNLNSSQMDELLHNNIYADTTKWHQFFKILLMGLGIGMLISGLIFLIAYNWDLIPNMIKLGVMIFIFGSISLLYLLRKFSKKHQNNLILVLSFLVGISFALFGQIYQTGADTYDFFMGWSVFIFLFTIVSSYAPQWLLFHIVTMLAINLYGEQVGIQYNTHESMFYLFMTNLIFLFLYYVQHQLPEKIELSRWYFNYLILIGVYLGTCLFVFSINSSEDKIGFGQFLIVFVAYVYGLYYAYIHRNMYMFSLISFSVVIFILYHIVDMFDSDIFAYLFLILILLGGYISLISLLQKKWNNERN